MQDLRLQPSRRDGRVVVGVYSRHFETERPSYNAIYRKEDARLEPGRIRDRLVVAVERGRTASRQTDKALRCRMICPRLRVDRVGVHAFCRGMRLDICEESR